MKHQFKKICFLILILFVQYDYIRHENNVRNLKIINSFPTEEQMLRDNFSLHQGINFCYSQDSIYFCDQFEHQIVQFDLDGNLIRQIGECGQGPGELQYPLYVNIYKDKLFVTDNRNSRIQIFSLDGTVEGQIKLITTFSAFVVIDDKIIILNAREAGASDRENANIFEVYNLRGEIIKKIKGSFFSKYNIFRWDNKVTLRSKDKFFHCLQQYGTTYRIYNSDGDLIKEFELEINPLKDRRYKKLKYLFTYQTFCINDEKIYAGVAWIGKIMIFVFDMNGNYLFQYESIMDKKNEIYDIYCIDIIKRNNKKYFYILLTEPNIKFMVAELE